MIIYTRDHKNLDLDKFLGTEDLDRRGLELCLEQFNRINCRSCSLALIVLDAFFDYFIENLVSRKVHPELIGGYAHIHNGQLSLHCHYNGCAEEGLFRTKEKFSSVEV